jgi:hypothetical protein
MNENRSSLAYRGDGVINTKVFRPDDGGAGSEATVDALGRATHGLPGDVGGNTAGKSTGRFGMPDQGSVRFRAAERTLSTDGFSDTPDGAVAKSIAAATLQTAFHKNEAGAETERTGPDTNAASGAGGSNYP